MREAATVAETAKSIRNGNQTSTEVVEQYLQLIQQHASLNAYTEVSSKALDQAEEIDEQRRRGLPMKKLSGVPIAVKDMICTKGMRTTAGSKMLQNFISPYSATLVERLEQEGAIIIGKTNQDEFAMGSSNEFSFWGPTKNPWNLDYVPGGSSGGSAAAVAAHLCSAAIGTDTGGSIRQPAHFCGVVGLKPSYGRISRYGVIAYASSLDQAGPMTRSVRDAALLAEIMSGPDSRDATSSKIQVPKWSENLASQLNGVRVGRPQEFLAQTKDQDTLFIQKKVEDFLKDAGATIVDIELPMSQLAVPVYYLIASSEASSNLARYDGVRYGHRADFSGHLPKSIDEFYGRNRAEGFGVEVKRRLIMGTYFLSAGYTEQFYQKACRVRRLISEEWKNAFAKCDVVFSPVALAPAFKFGEKVQDPLEMYLNDILTVTANLVGLPAMSVPVGLSSSGLPIGIQITSKMNDEQTLLNVGAAIEERAQWNYEALNGL